MVSIELATRPVRPVAPDSISPLLAAKTKRAVVAIAGKQEPMPVAVFKAPSELHDLLSMMP